VYSPRHLDWDGCVNVRDLGGLPLGDGQETAFRAVVRADNLAALSDAGWEALRDYGVSRIVDLRWVDERAADPVCVPTAEVVHVGLFGDYNERHDADRRLLERIPDHAECRRVMYLEHLEDYPSRFAAAIEAVAEAPSGCVAVHCAAGIDRTGLVAALLLRLAGVSREDVAADYGLSRASWEPFVPEWLGSAEDEREGSFRRFLAAILDTAMLGVLVDLDESRGGAEGYLRDAGVSDATIERARAKLRP
jgi:protein tyrosine/serine phosphatase